MECVCHRVYFFARMEMSDGQGVVGATLGVVCVKRGKGKKIWDLPVEVFCLLMAFLPLRVPYNTLINWREHAHWVWAGWVSEDPGTVVRFLGLREPMLWKWYDFRIDLGSAWADIGWEWLQDTVKRVDHYAQMCQIKWGSRIGKRKYGYFDCRSDYDQFGIMLGRQVVWKWKTKAKKEWKRDNRVCREIIRAAYGRPNKHDKRYWYQLQLVNNYVLNDEGIDWENGVGNWSRDTPSSV